MAFPEKGFHDRGFFVFVVAFILVGHDSIFLAVFVVAVVVVVALPLVILTVSTTSSTVVVSIISTTGTTTTKSKGGGGGRGECGSADAAAVLFVAVARRDRVTTAGTFFIINTNKNAFRVARRDKLHGGQEWLHRAATTAAAATAAFCLCCCVWNKIPPATHKHRTNFNFIVVLLPVILESLVAS